MINPNYLLAIPDGLITRPSGIWAAEKLDYLHRYIDTFETAMRLKWPQRNYIDLFAGPGKNLVKSSGDVLLGSPILALTTKYPFTGYYFSELAKSNLDALRLRCSASPHHARIKDYAGDANVIVNSVVADIKQYSTHSLNLAFLDPDGLELEWSTIKKLGNLRCDLIIHYSQQGISRNIAVAYESANETIVDRFFGSSEWRKIYAQWYKKTSKKGMHRELIDFYKERLLSLGYQEVKQSGVILTEPLIRNIRSNAPLYRLIFASKDQFGDRFWQQITSRDIHGQKRMF